MVKLVIEKRKVVSQEYIDDITKKKFTLYFGNIPNERIDQILFEIAKKGINEENIASENYLSEFLARENLTLK